MSCRACNAPSRPGDRYCSQCGVRQALDAEESLPSELKFVTALRCDIVASTPMVAGLAPEDAVRALQSPLSAMKHAVSLHRGTVCRELGDGILAVFGAPLASDNHAVAALYAAFELVEQMHVLHPDVQVRVGVHSSSVITRVISTDYSSVYDIGGPALNMVERLQAIARPGDICASEACQRLAHGLIQFDEPESKVLKGFAQPVPVFRARAIAELSRWQARALRGFSTFVGRSDELDRLDEAVHNVRGRDGSCVRLYGEPGIGKSRLVHELLRRLRAQGWNVLGTECNSLHAMAPYSTLRRLFEAALEATSQRGPVGPPFELPERSCTAIDAVLDRQIVDSSWTEADPKTRSRAIASAWVDLLNLLGRSAATLVFIEDVHWLDQASGDVVRNAVASQQDHCAVMTLLTSRTIGGPDWVSSIATTEIELGPLDVAASRDLMGSLLGDFKEAPALHDRILRHTGCVPLFIEEVCRQLSESAHSSQRLGLMEALDDMDRLGVPTTVQGVIAARIDHLPRPTRVLLQVAAVFGPDCNASMLRSVAELDWPTFAKHIDALSESGILFRADRDGDSLVFPHDLIRQVAYESMLKLTRAQWHTKVLAALESRADVCAQRYETLCHHAMRASDWSKAFGYAREVVRNSVERSALADAAAFTNIALEAIDRLPMSVERERSAIDFRIEARRALVEYGQIDRMLSLAKEAVERASAIGDATRAMSSRAVRSAALNFYGDASQAVTAGEEVLEQALKLEDIGWVNYARYGVGQAYFMAGRYGAARSMFGLALEQLDGSDPQAVAGTTPVDLQLICSMMLTLTNVALGAVSQAEHFQRRAGELASQTPKAYGRVAAGYGRGVYLLSSGDPAASRSCLVETLALANRNDVALYIPVITCHLGIALLEEGRLDSAASTLAEASAGAGKIGHRSAYLRALLHHGLALSFLGQPAQGLRLTRRSSTASARGGFAGIEAEALLAEASIYAESSSRRMPAAFRRLDRAVELASRLEAEPLLVKSKLISERMALMSQRMSVAGMDTGTVLIGR